VELEDFFAGNRGFGHGNFRRVCVGRETGCILPHTESKGQQKCAGPAHTLFVSHKIE